MPTIEVAAEVAAKHCQMAGPELRRCPENACAVEGEHRRSVGEAFGVLRMAAVLP